MYAVQRMIWEGDKVTSKDVKFYNNESIGAAFKQLRKVYWDWKILVDCLTRDVKEFRAQNPVDGTEISFEFEPVDRQVIYRRPR